MSGFVSAICALLFGLIFHALFNAFAGFLTMTIGHYILRATVVTGYEYPLVTAMRIGALGGCLMAIPSKIVEAIYDAAASAVKRRAQEVDPESGERRHSNAVAGFVFIVGIVSIGLGIANGAAVGASGAAILRALHHVVMDPTHAARAGALGALILGPGLIGFLAIFFLCCGTVFGGFVVASNP